jgi:hypothetical protein
MAHRKIAGKKAAGIYIVRDLRDKRSGDKK